MRTASLLTCFFILPGLVPLKAQTDPFPERDPCGYPDTTSVFYKAAAAANWGYGYDSLRSDLQRWASSPYCKVDSIGASVQSRTLFLLTIEDTANVSSLRRRVWIHARTHPGEVQGTRVTNEMIAYLLSESDTARLLRSRCVFNILPMINPDGVEMALPRQNAHGIDIEGNWATTPGEPEVQAVRNKLAQLMAEFNPIEVALNMHSAFACSRYFVYHAAAGTSEEYASMEQEFIGLVQSYFPGAIEPWPYFVSWLSYPPPNHYPESWFWYNYQEGVLALTYEDMNCAMAGDFDSTAGALLKGIGEYLGVLTSVTVAGRARVVPDGPLLLYSYPNPFNPSSTITFSLPEPAFVTLRIHSLLGEEIATLENGWRNAGDHTSVWDAGNAAAGVYVCRLETQGHAGAIKMILLR